MEDAQAFGTVQATTGAQCWYARCRARLKKPLVCSQCKSAAYCSRDCQVKDWKAGHKQACKGRVKTKEDAAGNGGRNRSGQDGVSGMKEAEAVFCNAIGTGDMEKAEMLVVEGLVPLHWQDKNGVTALMVASFQGHGEVIHELLEKGACLNMQDGDVSSTLMLASYHGDREVVEMLMGKGANGKWLTDAAVANDSRAQRLSATFDAASPDSVK